jgi:zinc transporter
LIPVGGDTLQDSAVIDPAEPLVWAFRLDGAGSGQRLNWEQVCAADPNEGRLWIHLNRTSAAAQTWLRERTGLTPATCEALLAEETRPRAQSVGGGEIVILRAVNLNPGADPDDMLTIRLWVDSTRLISLRQRRLRATGDAAEELEVGRGPRSLSDLLVYLCRRISDRIEPVLENLDVLADGLEESVAEREPRVVRAKLADLRQQVIALRRYLAPQRVTLTSLSLERAPWLEDHHRAILRELADRTTRQVEDLEELRERATVIHDYLTNHVAEQVNSRMYVLSVITTIFLPLSFLTGLLGINVGGMPGADSDAAFWIVCALMLVSSAALFAILRWRRWL